MKRDEFKSRWSNALRQNENFKSWMELFLDSKNLLPPEIVAQNPLKTAVKPTAKATQVGLKSERLAEKSGWNPNNKTRRQRGETVNGSASQEEKAMSVVHGRD